MKIIASTMPSAHQFAQTEELCRTCMQFDGISLDFPNDGAFYVFAEETAEGAKETPTTLAAALSLFCEDDTLYTLSAFTAPDKRRSGLFSELLDCAIQWLEETAPQADIDIIADPVCKDAIHTLHSLSAEHLYDDFLMELRLAPPLCPLAPLNHVAVRTALSSENNEDSVAYYLIADDSKIANTIDTNDTDNTIDTADTANTIDADDTADTTNTANNTDATAEWICQIQITRQSETVFWLHHVQTNPAWQHQGMASRLLSHTLHQLCSNYPNGTVRLHVTSDNPYALALYKKAGFQIIQTLSHYLY